MFERVIGMEREKRELEKVINQIKNPELYDKQGVKLVKGIMFYGEPGVGKTLLSEEFMKESGVKYYICRRSESSGRFAQKIMSIFEEAKASAKEDGASIVLLDDMDKYANARYEYRDAEEYIAVQSCIDGCKNENVIVLATVNDKMKLPESLLRSGRFDIKFNIRPPFGEDAKKLAEYFLRGKKIDDTVSLDVLCDMANDENAASLENLINDTAGKNIYKNKEFISMDDLVVNYINRYSDIEVNYAPIKYDQNYTEDMRMRVAYHEAGHAVVNELINPGSVVLVAIHDSFMKGVTKIKSEVYGSKRDYDRCLYTYVAGKVATELKFPGYDCGAQEDMQNLGDLVSHISSGLGASDVMDVIGLTIPHSSENKQFLTDMNKIKIARDAYKNTMIILANNMAFFETVAQALMEHKYITRKEIAEIKAKCNINEVCLRNVGL